MNLNSRVKQKALLAFFATSLIFNYALLRTSVAVAQEPAAARSVDFNRDIRPILSDNCFACHGPDEKQRQQDLRLDTHEGLFEDRGLYRIVVPGDLAASKLFERISAVQESQRMPPVKSGRKLTQEQIELIRRWIEQGAKWEQHWAFVPFSRPPLPDVEDKSWPRNPIDYFILSRLEREGLKPSVEADRVTLIRRVTYDLTGLPPTPQEVDAFLADHSPDAYERVVDRLLHSPRYGERMAMKWLDLARYADTHGYHIDSHRDMWPWRDWLISAHNRNLPFDQFTAEQLAGDLLPNATLEHKIASGFNRNHMINFEGGAIPEEYQNEYVIDRVNTTSTVWMGLTIGCARCHDHKYDPVSQREFYQFYAFFNDIPEKGLDGREGNAPPFIQVPNALQQTRLEDVNSKIAELEKALPESETDALQSEWEKNARSQLPSPSSLIAHYELDGHFADTSGHYHHGQATTGEVTYQEGRIEKAARFDGDTQVSLGDIAGFDRADQFSIATWIRPTGKKRMAVLARAAEDSQRGYGVSFGESEVLPYAKQASPVIVYLVDRWPDRAIEIRTRQTFLLGAWHHFVIHYDGSGKAAGIQIYANGEVQEVEVTRDNLNGSIHSSEPLFIGKKKDEMPFEGSLDELRIYPRLLERAEIEQLAIHQPVASILRHASEKRTKEQKKELRDYFLSRHAPPPVQKFYVELKDLRRQKEELDQVIPTVMVMQHEEAPRDTFLLTRGDYRSPGEKVTPGVPSCLPPLSKDAPLNRLSLAQWLVDPSHPLTARVAVNRYWEMYFGNGLVSTMENFGTQGEPSSHPELLDWLATEFIRIGWDIKGMQRLIVTSATYRQSSRVTPELLRKDPQNRLLARAPRLRFPAEVIRDTALTVSGLLNGEIGGPSVFPYQPPGLWELFSYGDRYSAQSYKQSHGKDLYRRSMYTFWKRTAPPPSMATFDAPDRETCTIKRSRTNTPLQALVLMNDPTFVEAARALAQRMLREVSSDPADRVSFAFRLAAARRPAPQEVEILLDAYRQQLAVYRNDREAALKLLSIGESKYDESLEVSDLAAWTTLASMILTLDETITRE